MAAILADDIFNYIFAIPHNPLGYVVLIFVNEKFYILIEISLKYVP